MAKYFGTPIPTEGVVEKVYFNNELSGKEVNIILNTIELQDTSNWNLYYIIAVNKEDNTALILRSTRDRSNNYVYIVDENDNYTVLFDLQNWTDNKGQVDLNFELSTTSEYFHSDAEIGTQNYKLAKLFSITPFKVEKNILMHPKDETGKMNTNISLFPKTLATNLMTSGGKPYNMPNVVYKQGWGTPIPNSGLVEKVYFNTNLSVEEVVSILESANLNYNHKDFFDEGLNSYLVLDCSRSGTFDESISASLHIAYVEGFYTIMFEQTLLWTNYPEMSGWNPEQSEDFNNPIDLSMFGLQFVSNINGEAIGQENSKLSSLFSITPFTSGGLFETNEDGTPNTDKPIQTGISEERVNELIDAKIGDFLGGES